MFDLDSREIYTNVHTHRVRACVGKMTVLSMLTGSLSDLLSNSEPVSKNEIDQIRRTSRYAKRLKAASSSSEAKPSSSLFLGIIRQCRRTDRCNDSIYQRLFIILPGEWMKAVVHTLHRIGGLSRYIFSLPLPLHFI